MMKVRVLLEPPVRRKRRAGVLDWTRRLFLLVGLCALGYAGYVYLDAQFYQRYQDWSFDQEAAGKTPSVGDFLRDQASNAGDQSQPAQDENQPAPAPAPP